MTKVLKVVPSNFTNETRDLREVNAIGRQGYQVKVIAIQDTEQRLSAKEHYNYFELERLNVGISYQPKSSIKRIIKYLRFCKRAVRYGIRYEPDIISSQDFAGLLVGYLIKHKLKNRPKLLYDSHELGTHISSNMNYPGIVVWVKRFLEKALIKKADVVMVVSESIAKYIQQDCELSEKPVVVRNIPPYQILAAKPDTFRKIFNIGWDKHILLYQGNLGAGRGVDTIIRVLAKLEDSFVLVIMGNGEKDEYIQLANELNLHGRVFFHPAVPYEKLIQFTSSADMGIMILNNICLSYYYALPNKLFEYIQFELPVVCSNFPDIQKVVSEYKVGETVNPQNLEEISVTIKKIFDNNKLESYKENSRRAKRELNWEKEQSTLLSLYSNLANS